MKYKGFKHYCGKEDITCFRWEKVNMIGSLSWLVSLLLTVIVVILELILKV